MAKYAVRRLGMAPCTEVDYRIARKKERLSKAGDTAGLKKLEEVLAKKKDAKIQDPSKVKK